MAEELDSKMDNTVEETPFLLNDDQISEVVDAVREQDSDTVHEILNDLSAPDTAELVAKINDDERQELLSMYSDQLDPVAFTEMDTELRRAAFEHLEPTEIAAIIKELESDDALELIIDLDADLQKAVIQKLSVKIRRAVEEGLSFPEDSAGRLMQREFIAVPQFWDVGKTLDYMRSAAEDLPEDFFDIFIVNPAYHVVGQIPLNKLIRAPRDAKLEEISLDETHPLNANIDQEEVAHIFRRDNTASAPVVDDSGRLIGVITIDDVVDVIDEEAQEDILKMAGVEGGDLYRAVWSTSSTRFRWLFLNLLTAILASIIISLFDATIQQIVALAVLMPIVASMGGNAGTQALTVAVRALATRELSNTNTWRIVWKETLVGSFNGVAFAIITGLITWAWFGDVILGGVIATAMIINLIVAGLFGAGIPILINRYGGDPAVSSTVFLTTITDVVGFFAFLGLAALLLF
ncbi:MAG: magnesium transporter [Pseudomonadota bacterium]